MAERVGPHPLAVEVASLLRRYRFRFVDEMQLHAAIAGAFADAHVEAEREVRLSRRDRVDFLVADVGVEVKVKGATAAVEQQLRRYAESDRIRALVLVTSCARHAAIARELDGIPVEFVSTFGMR